MVTDATPDFSQRRPIATCDDAVTYVRDAICRGAGGRLLLRARREALPPGTDATLVLTAPRRWLPWRSASGYAAVGVTDALCRACQADRRLVYLVGGTPGRPGIPSGAQRAAAILGLRHRGLRIAGAASPPPRSRSWTDLIAAVVEAKPDLMLVSLAAVPGVAALQEQLIARLRTEVPNAWVFGLPGLICRLVGDANRRRVPRLLNW